MKNFAYKSLLIYMAFVLVTLMCGCDKNAGKKTRNKAASAITVDALMADPEPYLDKEVVVEGFCTYFNKRTTKVYLRGRELILLRVDAPLSISQQLDSACINHSIIVEGILRENRIDSTAVAQFENEYAQALAIVRRGDSLTMVQQQILQAQPAYKAGGSVNHKPIGNAAANTIAPANTPSAKNKAVKEQILADPENFATRMELLRKKIQERDSVEGKPYISEYYLVAKQILKIDK